MSETPVNTMPYLIMILLVFPVLILGIYAWTEILRKRHAAFIEEQTAQFRILIDLCKRNRISLCDVHIAKRAHAHIRALVLEEFSGADWVDQGSLRNAYERFGFLGDDLRQLKEHDWRRRVEALDRLGAIKMVQAEDAVFALLSDPKGEVRVAALRVLVEIGSTLILQPVILQTLLTDTRRWKPDDVAHVLVGAEIPVQPVLDLLLSTSGEVRKTVAVLLGRKGHIEAIPVFRMLVHDPLYEVRREAVRSLCRIGQRDIIHILSSKADDPYPGVRAEVARGLGMLGLPQALPYLDTLADDPEEEVRKEALHALSGFGKEGRTLIGKYAMKYPGTVRDLLNREGLAGSTA